MNRNYLKRWINNNLFGKGGKPVSNKIKKEWFERNELLNYYNEIISRTNFLKPDCKFTERIYCILNDIVEPVYCSMCNQVESTFKNFRKGYSDFCRNCLNKNKAEIDRIYKNMEPEKYQLLSREEVKGWMLENLFNKDDQLKIGRLKKSWFYKHGYSEYWENMMYYTDFIEESSSISERIYCIINDILNPVYCEYCMEKKTNYINFNKGYRKFCSDFCAVNSDYFKELARRTLLDKYGVEVPIYNKQIKNQMKNTKEERYGDPFYTNVEKSKKTKKQRYGDANYNNLNQIRKTKEQRYGDSEFKNFDKIKETNLNNLGYEFPLQDPKTFKKAKETCLKNNGVEHPLQSWEIYSKTNNGKSISKPQRNLFNVCQRLLPYPILEYHYMGKYIDIAVPSLSLAIEYDGSYWHDEEKDRERQEFLESFGWKFLRYKDHIPTKQELLNDVNQLVEK